MEGEHTNEIPSFFLTYRNGAAGTKYKRYQKCSSPKPTGKNCDEFPFASTTQGGPRAGASFIVSNKWVGSGESDRQGGMMSAFYSRCREQGAGKNWRTGLYGNGFIAVGLPEEPVSFSMCDKKINLH